MENKVKILVAHYRPEHLTGATMWSESIFTPWDVQFNVGSKLLEFDLLKKMRNDMIMENNEYSGLISHSAYTKLAMPTKYLSKQIQDGIDNNVDAILINPAIACNAFFKNGIEQAQLIGQNKIEYLFTRLGLGDYASATLPYYSFIMCSYIIAKKQFWESYFDYVDAILAKAENIANEDEMFKKAYFGESDYKVKKGFDYRPFIIERIPQILINKFNMKIKYVESPKLTFAIKFGPNAKLIHELYRLKKRVLKDSAEFEVWNKFRQPFLMNNALCYKITARGEFYRSADQVKYNMNFIENGDFV
jgi:hypothetical protein